MNPQKCPASCTAHFDPYAVETQEKCIRKAGTACHWFGEQILGWKSSGVGRGDLHG